MQARARPHHRPFYAARQSVPILIADDRAPYTWTSAESPSPQDAAESSSPLRRLLAASSADPASSLQLSASDRARHAAAEPASSLQLSASDRAPQGAADPASSVQLPASHRTHSTALAEAAASQPERLTEAQLTTLWRGRRFPAAALVTRAGVPVTVIHQGRPGRGPGPDFRDAVIAGPSGLLLRGDIELHVRASSFRAHGHATDPAYANVILHVVFDDEGEAETALPGGRSAPVIALGPWVARRAGELQRWLRQPLLWREPCHDAVGRLGSGGAGAALDTEGDRRLSARTERAATAIAESGLEQVLYEWLLEALGYGGNAPQMLLLSRTLSWRALVELALAKTVKRLGFEALLLGSAGLLPSQRSGAITEKREQRTEAGGPFSLTADLTGTPPLHPHVAALERAFAQQRQKLPSLAPGVWKHWGVRPENAPARRIAAAAALLDALGKPSALMRVLDAGTVNEAIALLTAAAAQGYWLSHYDLCAPPCQLPPGFIGRSRAVEIIINVVLPAALATGDGERARALFARLPRPAAYGATKFIEAALASDGPRVPINARRAQGLLALNKEWCTQGGCGRCPLS